MEKSPRSKERVTLQEYLLAHRIRKQIEERHRSRSKNKKQINQKEEDRGANSIYHKLDVFLNNAKINIQQIVSGPDVNPERLFFHLSKLLDVLIADIKEDLRKTFRQIYSRIQIEKEEKATAKEVADSKFFQDQLNEANSEKKKSKISETVKQSFRNQAKNKQIIESLMNGAIVEKNFSPNSNIKIEQNEASNSSNPSDQPMFFMSTLFGLPPAQPVKVQEYGLPNSVKQKPKISNQIAVLKKNTLDVPPVLIKRDSDFIGSIDKRENKKPFERRPQPGYVRSPNSKQKK